MENENKEYLKFAKEIYYHGEINCKYNSYYLDLLNKADMMIYS